MHSPAAVPTAVGALDAPQEPPPRLHGPPDLLRAVARNLLQKRLTHTTPPHSGTVTLSGIDHPTLPHPIPPYL